MTAPSGPEPARDSAPASALSATASEQVRAILEAAEGSAAEIRRVAEAEAAEIRGRAEAEVGRVSASVEATVRRLEALHAELGTLIDSLREEAPAPREATPVLREATPAPPVSPREAPPAAAAADVDGARLVALNMALEGVPREETAEHLAAHFALADCGALLDEVYASLDG